MHTEEMGNKTEEFTDVVQGQEPARQRLVLALQGDDGPRLTRRTTKLAWQKLRCLTQVIAAGGVCQWGSMLKLFV